MEPHEAWNWCWADPACLAFPVAWIASLVAIARRVDRLYSRSRSERGWRSLLRSCFAGATFTGVAAFSLELGIGSLWPDYLKVVTMINLLTSVAIDWSAESASGFMRTLLLTTLEAYLTKCGLRLERIPEASRTSLPDEPDKSRRPPSPGPS